MDFLELLITQGLSEEQVSEITKAMKKNKIFITYEEKIEERYHKMKLQRDTLRDKLELAEKAGEDQQKNLGINEDIQRIRKAFEDRTAALKNQYEDKIREMAIDMTVLEKLGDVKYPELLLCKFDKSRIRVNSDGVITGIEEQLSDIRKAYGDMFPARQSGVCDTDGERLTGIKKPDSTCFNIIFQTDLPVQGHRQNHTGSSGRKTREAAYHKGIGRKDISMRGGSEYKA
jgi:hypothetical protein